MEVLKINESEPTEEGTVFPTMINDTEIKTLFDKGATKSVLSGQIYRDLKLGELDTTNLPTVVGANHTSLGVLGHICCKIKIGKKDFFLQTLEHEVFEIETLDIIPHHWTPQTRKSFTQVASVDEKTTKN